MRSRRRGWRSWSRVVAFVAVTAIAGLGSGAAAPAGARTADATRLPLSWVRDSPVLGRGDTGTSVREWQGLMNDWLAVAASDDPLRLELDGAYGRLTDSITRRFQAVSGVPVDGIVGPLTRAALLSSPALIDAGAGPAAHEPSLEAGDAGPAVADWQQAMNTWFRATGAQPGLVAVDGEFGPSTRDATLAFQRSQGVTADGIVGPETRAALLSAPALANPVGHAAATPEVSPSTPAAGVCAPAAAVAVIRLGPDVPTPRCVIVSGSDQLRVVNDGPATRVTLGSFVADVAAGATVTTVPSVGEYVEPGARTLAVARYGDSGPDVIVR
jgi:peptidoglycan hydrolase-like protein with peptidoglycan-binding domain